jgi:glycosyltransferase involved in cell wall biosynthesis
MNRLKVAVFNRFWATMGGGEQLAASYALALAEMHSVELISTSRFDLDLLARRLGHTTLSNLPVRIVGDSPTAISEISGEYDIFINHSFTSEDVNLSPFGVYVCMFPQAFRRPTRGDLGARFQMHLGKSSEISVNGDSALCHASERITLISEKDETLTLFVETSSSALILENEETARCVERIPLDPATPRQFLKVTVPAGKHQLVFNGASDRNRILSPRLGDGMRVYLDGAHHLLEAPPAFVSSYNVVLSISEFTQKYVADRWASKSTVHYPPVELRPESFQKENVILSVGRFFSEEVGHCKQQLKLVRAFRKMVDQGLTSWRLSLVGGCDRDHKDYALEVRRAAAGYPIDVFLNADLEKLDQEFSRAKIFWHATGFGTNTLANPDRAEHFGIAPIEAMSAGAIPIVFDFGGPREVIGDHGAGYVFSDETDLIEKTMRVIRLVPEDRDVLQHFVVQSAKRFSRSTFQQSLKSILSDVPGTSKQ